MWGRAILCCLCTSQRRWLAMRREVETLFKVITIVYEQALLLLECVMRHGVPTLGRLIQSEWPLRERERMDREYWQITSVVTCAFHKPKIRLKTFDITVNYLPQHTHQKTVTSFFFIHIFYVFCHWSGICSYKILYYIELAILQVPKQPLVDRMCHTCWPVTINWNS